MKWLRVLFGQVAKPIDFGNNLAVQDQFVKNNVVNQMGNVSKIDFVKYAKQTIQVHGFVFDLKNGSLLKVTANKTWLFTNRVNLDTFFTTNWILFFQLPNANFKQCSMQLS
ncbi:19464_t:CDS:2 [Entrophospora sp. SA101]|nr:19464_t:CDS:2 [Entrophospora sp. SA101]